MICFVFYYFLAANSLHLEYVLRLALIGTYNCNLHLEFKVLGECNIHLHYRPTYLDSDTVYILLSGPLEAFGWAY